MPLACLVARSSKAVCSVCVGRILMHRLRLVTYWYIVHKGKKLLFGAGMLRAVAYILIILSILVSDVSAQQPALNTQAEPVVVTVDRQGRVFLQGTEIPPDDLKNIWARLWNLTVSRKGLDEPIFVRADNEVAFGEVMRVVGVITSSGYKHISFVTAAENNSKQPAAPPTPATAIAASCAEAITRRIEQNWTVVPGTLAGENTIIRLRIKLNPDGTLATAPAVLDQLASAVSQAMAGAAVSAAIRGQPYILSPQQYEQCKTVILRFDPRRMYGG